MSAGMEEMTQLRNAGFGPDEISAWRSQTESELSSGGFSSEEISDYFGDPKPDMAPMKDYIQGNLAKAQNPETAPSLQQVPSDAQQPEGKPIAQPEVADSFLKSIEAGFEMSVSGLLARQKLPDTVLPEHADMAWRIGSQIGTIAGDLPAMFVGMVEGGAAGSVVAPGIGTAIGAGAGGFALPTAMREFLVQNYEKGQITDFNDFWARSSALFLETGKSAVIGAATGGVGAKVGAAAAGLAPAAKATAVGASEIATMVTVGAALEGHVPSAEEFVEAAVFVGGLNALGAGTKVSRKLYKEYAKTGERPAEVAQRAQTEPGLKQELLSENIEPVAAKPAKEVAAPELSDATKTILSKVGEKAEREKPKYTYDDFYKDVVDKFDPIAKAEKLIAEGKELPASESGYKLVRMVNDYPSLVKHSMEKGTIDFNSKLPNGKGVAEIVRPFKQNMQDFDAYRISKRAIEKAKQGINTGFDLKAAEQVVKEGAAKYEKAHQEMVEFSNRTLQYLVDSGRVSKDSFNNIKRMNEEYIPFTRIMDAEFGAGTGKSGAGFLKELKGSDLKIQSPMESIKENTSTIFKLAEKNRAIKTIVDGHLGAGTGVFKKVKTPLKPIEVKAEEINRALEDQGIRVSKESIKRNLKEKGLKVSDEMIEKAFENENINNITAEDFTVFRSNKKELGPNQFELWRDGKREVYETEIPELAEAIKLLDGDVTSTNMAIRIAQGMTTALRTGITLDPAFQAKNLFRDNLIKSVFSTEKGLNIPFVDTIAAMGNLIKKDDTYYAWLRSGGSNGAFLDLGAKYLEKNVYELDRQTGFMGAARNVVQKPFELLAVAGTLAEQATRLAEFKRVTKGEYTRESLTKGGFAAREITLDFQRIGAKTSALNQIVAFMNVGIQGLDKTARAVKADPAGVAMRTAIYVTAPSVLLWWANKDEQWYKDAPQWQKDLFWMFEAGGTIYRVPKPQELGLIFGSLPERVLDNYFTDNPDALKDFDDTIIDLIKPSVIPDAITPPIEHYFNKSFFTGNPIVSRANEGLLPEDQYTEYTSETAKALGKVIGSMPNMKENAFASPQILENYIKGWTGTLGGYALQLADQALIKSGAVPDPVKPEDTLADIPFVKAFVVRYPSAGAQPIKDLYELQRSNAKYINSMKLRAKEQNIPGVEDILANNQDKLLNLDKAADAVTAQAKAARMIFKNKDMSPTEKRQLIDNLYFGMIETARESVKSIREVQDQIKKEVKE
jgi:hypothetical protein